MSVYDLTTTDALLSTTRSVRKRLDLQKPVPRQVILDCIALSQQAPTGSNSQDWRWLVVTDADKRRALAELYYRNASAYLAPTNQESVTGGDAQTSRVIDSARYLMDHLHEVPVHVIPCIEVKNRKDASPEHWASVMGSIYPAVWSFNLALRARGLGSVLTTLHLGHADEAAALLGIPDNMLQAGLLPVAYTLGTDFRPAQRPPPESITARSGVSPAACDSVVPGHELLDLGPLGSPTVDRLRFVDVAERNPAKQHELGREFDIVTDRLIPA